MPLLEMVVACSSFSCRYGGMGGYCACAKTSVLGFGTTSNWNWDSGGSDWRWRLAVCFAAVKSNVGRQGDFRIGSPNYAIIRAVAITNRVRFLNKRRVHNVGMSAEREQRRI